MKPERTVGRPNKPIIAVLSVIASLIAIFVFVTGKESIPDIAGTIPNGPTNTQNQRSTLALPDAAPTPTNPLFPTPSPTRLPASPTPLPEVIDIHNPGISVLIQHAAEPAPPDMGVVRIRFLAAGEPLTGIHIQFYHSMQDITGEWVVTDWVTDDRGVVGGETDYNGSVAANLSPGNYVAGNDDFSATWNQLVGTWGVMTTFAWYNDPLQALPFPVFAGKTTDITVELALLEIGLLSPEGSAIRDRLVYVLCQTQDVAGQTVPSDCGAGDNMAKTDATGLARFSVGPGTYVIIVENGRDDASFYDISLSPAALRREILTVP